MRRPALYSSSRSSSHDRRGGEFPDATDTGRPPESPPPSSASSPSRLSRLAQHLSPHNIYLLWTVVGLLALLLAINFALSPPPAARKLTQANINAAVLKTLETTVLPSAAAKAYEIISPSVVRVVGMSKSNASDSDKGKARGKTDAGKEGSEHSVGVGTGVVIVDKGIILTNLHVVQGAETIKVIFADGLESTASITGVQPENDLAVLQAHKIPDDMIAATIRSTADLAPGDEVMAVGFPFGIGPSASAGIISGLKRNFRSPEGKQLMTNLIQFDAAANPGNSGGPLVTMDGEVIGIVTAIYNPNQQRTFVGIGFAVPIENAASAAGMPPF